MREYETTIIIQPEISDEGAKAILDRAVATIEEHGDTRLCCEDLGKRKLAYEIRKFHKGHYFILSDLGQGKEIPELERRLRLDESVLRFLTVKVSDRVDDVEARIAAAAEFEADQAKRAEEKAAREVEIREREEAERAEAEAAAASRRAAEEAAAAAPADPPDGEVAEAAEGAAEPGDEAPAPEAASEPEPKAAPEQPVESEEDSK